MTATPAAVDRVLVRRQQTGGGPVGAGNKKKMKASSTTGNGTRDGRHTREGTSRTTVALATRDKILSAILAARLTAECDTVALVCPNLARLLPWLEENPADVLVLDERWLQGRDASVPSLRARWPALRVLLLGDRACTALAEQVVRNRFHGFLLASGAADACVKAVRTVKQGETWVPRALLIELLFQHFQATGQGPPDGATTLTHREVQVIGYVRRGLANKQIADALAIREDTVKKHLRNAYTKLGVHRRSEIIVTSSAERLVSG